VPLVLAFRDHRFHVVLAETRLRRVGPRFPAELGLGLVGCERVETLSGEAIEPDTSLIELVNKLRQPVEDRLPFVDFDAPEGMDSGADEHVGAVVDGLVREIDEKICGYSERTA
jgi:hypothetical protein